MNSSEGADYDRCIDICRNIYTLGYSQKFDYRPFQDRQKNWETHRKIGNKDR